MLNVFSPDISFFKCLAKVVAFYRYGKAQNGSRSEFSDENKVLLDRERMSYLKCPTDGYKKSLFRLHCLNILITTLIFNCLSLGLSTLYHTFSICMKDNANKL
jgi:hypothetical protein